MRLIQFLTIVALLSCLPACLTAYRAPTATMSSCEDYDKYLYSKYPDQKSLIQSGSLADEDDANPGAEDKFGLEDRNKKWTPHPKEEHLSHIDPIIVRYSEGGDLVSRCDYSRVLHALINTNSKKRVVFVYIHGWRNDSGKENNKAYNYGKFPTQQETGGKDLHKFREFLRERQRMERERTDKDPAVVIGVFVSWKGRSGIPYLDYWSRRSGADKLARSAQVARLFGAMENIIGQECPASSEMCNDPSTKTGTKRSDTKLIYMSHSMGARVLYGAMAPRFTYNVQRAYPIDKTAPYAAIPRGPDLVLMISPALEAASYKSIDEFRYSDRRFVESHLPQMLVIQSEGDWATRSAFAIAESFGRLNDPYQSAQRRRTIGHSPQFVTHKLVKLDSPCIGETKKVTLTGSFCHGRVKLIYCPKPNTSTKNVPPAKRKRENHVLVSTQAKETDNSEPFEFDTECVDVPEVIRPKKVVDRKLRPSPFFVVQVEKDVLSAHGFFLDAEANSRAGKADGDGFLPWLHEYITKFEAELERGDEKAGLARTQAQ